MGFKKTLKIFLLSTVSLLIAIIIILVGTLSFAYVYPKKSWNLMQHYILPEDLKISWETMDAQWSHTRFIGGDLVWTIKGLQITKQKPTLNIPVENLQLNISIGLNDGVQPVRLHELKILSKKAFFKAEPSTEPTTKMNPFQQLEKYLSYADYLKKIEVEQFNVDVQEFTFEAAEGTSITANLKVDKQLASPGLHTEFKLILNSDLNEYVHADLILWPHKINSQEVFLSGKISLFIAGTNSEQNLSIAGDSKSKELFLKGHTSYQKEKLKINVSNDLTMNISADEIVTNVVANLEGLPGPLVKIPNLIAKIKVPLDEDELWSEQASTFELNAPIKLFFVDEKMRVPLEKTCVCKIPETLLLRTEGSIYFSNLLTESASETPILKINLNLDSLDNKLMTADIGAGLEINKLNKIFLYKPALNSRIVIHSFKGLQEFLNAKNIIVPAPFNVLDGKIEFNGKGPVSANANFYEFPLEISAKLQSANQQVDLKANSLVRLDNKLTDILVPLKLAVNALQLQLPPLNPVGGIPKVKGDSRIRKEPKKIEKLTEKETKIKFSVSVEVETTTPGAIRLLSEFAKPYIPLSIKVKYQGKKDTQGYIQTEPFAVEYLRRTVNVEKLRVSLDDTARDLFPLNSVLRIDQAGYKIFINIQGDIKHPHIGFTSEPYLLEGDIISVLLYGRPSDQLVTTDAQTAGSFQSAIADRAIGLFGLWAFASTPIQSFSYNPVTKVYTATVVLAEGLTAGVGTNWEESTRLELRKRVSQQWVLTASWAPTESGELEQKLVLQWEQRF